MKVIGLVLLLIAGVALACTNFLITPGATVDGSAIISYAADSAALFGALYHNAHQHYPNGTMMEVYDWDTGKFLGKIPQVEETYNTVGNTNEYGLAIGETTFGGLEDLQSQKGAIIDYGSLIYLGLQRAKTAREAIQVMTDLVAKYGYASEGESFSIADKKEVWVMEMIGKGNFEKGAVWVARRVPDGHVTAHANQARIQQFPLSDPETCVYSPDVISFAKAHGYYPKTGSDANFSFSDVYNPVNFEGARACEMRAWSFFRSVVGAETMDKYCDYVQGKDLTHGRMEWSYKPSKKISVADVMDLMKDHLEGTKFDFTQDIGAGPFNMPYRWRPMTFTVDNKTYINERSTSTQQTGFVFVAQLRQNVPDFMTAKNWFGVDDAACTVFAPMFGSNTEIPLALDKNNGAIMNVTLSSSFWVFNLVANLAYTRWRIIYPEIKQMADNLEQLYMNESADAEKVAKQYYDANETERAVEYLTNYSKKTAQDLHDVWLDFWEYLVPRFLDGNVKTYVPGEQNPKVDWPGYGDPWYKRIVDDTGDKYLIPEDASSSHHSAASRAVPTLLPSIRKLLSFIHLW